MTGKNSKMDRKVSGEHLGFLANTKASGRTIDDVGVLLHLNVTKLLPVLLLGDYKDLEFIRKSQ